MKVIAYFRDLLVTLKRIEYQLAVIKGDSAKVAGCVGTSNTMREKALIVNPYR